MFIGNIRVYCRVRPLIGGHPNHHGTVSNIEEGSISVIIPSKNGKEGKKTFTLNKAFGPSATQGWSSFLSFHSNYCYSICLLHWPLFLFACSGGFLGYSTFDSIGSGWLQCLYICLWPDRVRKNTHYGERDSDDPATCTLFYPFDL